jgi:hypothetical protein
MMERMDQALPAFIASVTTSNGLIFLSHAEERMEHPMDGLTGMEIYNRHADAKKDVAGMFALALRLLDPAKLAELREELRLYPDEILAAQVCYQEDYMGKWDSETQKRRLTGVAANDCHHNTVFVVKMANATTVRVGTTVDKEEDLHRVTAAVCPGIVELTKGHNAGEELVRVDLDPYYRSFRNVTTHILAAELTEAAIRSALQQGHAFVSHDWMCDATGFSFALSPGGTARMGDEAKYSVGMSLVARFPVVCHIKLFLDGKLTTDVRCDRLENPVTGPGVYRVEGWLTIDGEERPWVCSNPIYLR